MLDGVVWAAERPLNTLNATGPQTLSPVRPRWPAAVHCSMTKLCIIAQTLRQMKNNTQYVGKMNCGFDVDLEMKQQSLCIWQTHLNSLGLAGISEAFLSHKHKSHSPPSSAGQASSAHRLPHTHTPLVTRTVAYGSSPGPPDTNNLNVKINMAISKWQEA